MRKRFMAVFLAMALCLGLAVLPAPAYAAEQGSGLPAFTDVKQYAAGVFQDVASGSWYEASVKTVYSKGIMDGTGGGRFAPQSTMPWSQAVTIAARLHAAYRGQAIPEAEGAWYVRYLDYAGENSLLPESCPDGDAVDSTPITREGLAVLFRSVLDEKDLPAVNDQTIPDLEEISPEYRDAVSEMFASGIFTGTDGGRFDPDGDATRAQVATIVARLLCPGQRVSHDSRQNPYMAEQMGNFYNGGIAARLDDTVYYMHSGAPEKIDNLGDEDVAIWARTDSGKIEKVYSSGEHRISYLSIGPDRMLYFIEVDHGDSSRTDTLQRLDPSTGAVTQIYSRTYPKEIGFYLFYDGQLYVYEVDASSNVDQQRNQIGRVSNGRIETLIDKITFGESTYIDESLYAFNGKLYFILIHDNVEGDARYMLHALDINSKMLTEVSGHATDLAYQDGTVWSIEYAADQKGKILRRFSLAMPELKETVCEYSGEFAGRYPNLYANGSQLYYQVSGAKKLWEISSTGQAEVIATAESGYIEASCVTSQGTLMLGVSVVGALNPSGIDVILPDGGKTNLSAFLGQPYALEGRDILTAADNQAEFASKVDKNDLYFDMLRAYVTPEGSVVLEAEIGNPSDKEFLLFDAGLKLGGGAQAEQCFDLGVKTIPAGKSAMFSFVFPKDRVRNVGDMADLKVEDVQFRGRYEGG